MKRTTVILCVVVLTVTSNAWNAPSGINVISEQHHVWGHAGTDPTNESEAGGVYNGYDVTASHPISGSATGVEVFSLDNIYPVTAASSAGSFAVSAHALRWTSWAEAESTYVFQMEPGRATLALDVSAMADPHQTNHEAGVALRLEDLSTSTLIEQFSYFGTAEDVLDWSFFTWTKTYPIDSSHTYSLYLYAGAFGGDGLREANLKVSVPAPGAVLLGTFGAGLVGWLRRRRIV